MSKNRHNGNNRKRRGRRRIIWIFAGVLLLTGLCIFMYHRSTKPPVGTGFQFTEEEKQFIEWNSVNTDAIERGELREWQIEMIKEYRVCKKYLNEKYPSHTFKIPTWDNCKGFRKWVVYADGDTNNVFHVYIYDDEEKPITDSWKANA